jgi:hypothetical protein
MYFDENNWKVKKFSNPYPFAEIDGFLTKPIYQDFRNKFPTMEKFSEFGDIKANNITIKKTFKDIEDQDLKKLSAYFVSKDFFKYMVDFFAADIKKHYPKIYQDIQADKLKIGISGIDHRDNVDVLLDFHIGINTPVKEVSKNRGPHLDNRKVLYVGLCYFKDENDPTSSGHYVAYDLLAKNVRLGHSRSVSMGQIKEFCQVKYGPNKLAVFLNTPRSVHGVSDREVTDYARRFFVFNAVFKNDLYVIKKTFFQKVQDKVKELLS